MIYLPFTESSAAILVGIQILALVMDSLLGEPRRFHPLIGFGRWVGVLERQLNRPKSGNLRLRGFVGWLAAVAPITAVCTLLLALLMQMSAVLFWIASTVVLYFCIGLKSLKQHARWVAEPMQTGDIEGAKAKVSWLVSRDTKQMDATQVNKACIESVLENGNDAVYGSLFWFLIAGAPGALVHRLANTLDASWGYRNERYREFGWWSARTDDWLNYLPARICALAYSLSGRTGNAFLSWRRITLWRKTEGKDFGSPNAGIVMASGAGALGLSLGGAAAYEGKQIHKPELGAGSPPQARDIFLSTALLDRSLLLFIAVQMVVYAVYRLLF